MRKELHELDKQWLAESPFCLIATSAADGSCDVSPKGDPAGFTKVLDDCTIAIPERAGNRRIDGFLNILTNPHVGMIFLIPGRGETLRINGRARIIREAPFFDDMIVRGNRPQLALLVEIEEIFHHCSKAFLRSKLWKPETWNPDAVPSRAEIAKTLDRKDADLDTSRVLRPEVRRGHLQRQVLSAVPQAKQCDVLRGDDDTGQPGPLRFEGEHH